MGRLGDKGVEFGRRLLGDSSARLLAIEGRNVVQNSQRYGQPLENWSDPILLPLPPGANMPLPVPTSATCLPSRSIVARNRAKNSLVKSNQGIAETRSGKWRGLPLSHGSRCIGRV